MPKLGSIFKRNADWAQNQKDRARYLLNRAIIYGWIYRRPCEVCGAEPAESHHVNYAEPYNVRWLCNFHHKKADRLKEYSRGILAEHGSVQMNILF